MSHIPAAFHPEAYLAMRVARILAEAGLVHPVSDETGECDALEWAQRFHAEQGTPLAPFSLDPARYDQALRAFVYQRAHFEAWIPRELRDTRGIAPADYLFMEQVAAVRNIQSIPATVPRSHAHQALVDAVIKELQRRALHSLRMGGVHEKGVMAFETDGRFEKLLMHGVRIASCDAGERNRDQWIAALESNLGIRVKRSAGHQVLIEIDGQDIACTEASVRVQVFNDRMSDDEDRRASLLFNFTAEGVIHDAVEQDGSLIGTDSTLYEDVLGSLVGPQDDVRVERMERSQNLVRERG